MFQTQGKFVVDSINDSFVQLNFCGNLIRNILIPEKLLWMGTLTKKKANPFENENQGESSTIRAVCV